MSHDLPSATGALPEFTTKNPQQGTKQLLARADNRGMNATVKLLAVTSTTTPAGRLVPCQIAGEIDGRVYAGSLEQLDHGPDREALMEPDLDHDSQGIPVQVAPVGPDRMAN